MIKEILNQQYKKYNTLEEAQNIDSIQIVREDLRRENRLLQEILSRRAFIHNGTRYITPDQDHYIFDNGDIIYDKEIDRAIEEELEELKKYANRFKEFSNSIITWDWQRDTLNKVYSVNGFVNMGDSVAEVDFLIDNYGRLSFNDGAIQLNPLDLFSPMVSPIIESYVMHIVNNNEYIPIEELYDLSDIDELQFHANTRYCGKTNLYDAITFLAQRGALG